MPGPAAAESVIVKRGPHSIFLTGPSNAGLLDPAKMAMTSLFQITTTLVLDEEPSVEDLVLVHAIDALKEAAEGAFVEAHQKLEKDEAAIDWDDPDVLPA